ncbi:MAG: hypothetical protein F4W95_13695 [Chloroflexi bacterium]|nr:hypothetical protein [Chloroflexota bacterium]MYD49516.1 hypothetical protein [Chloroflexota bacterium]
MTNFTNSLRIPPAILESVYREARAAYPAECCGWLTGPAGGDVVDVVRPAVNAQDEDALIPVEGRTSERAYSFNFDDIRALDESFASATPARIIYHSHPNGQAYFSETDREVATQPPGWGEGPVFPVQQLVVGIDAERVVEAALFGWDDDAGGFVELARYEGADV